jgi:hypothetical protein
MWINGTPPPLCVQFMHFVQIPYNDLWLRWCDFMAQSFTSTPTASRLQFPPSVCALRQGRRKNMASKAGHHDHTHLHRGSLVTICRAVQPLLTQHLTLRPLGNKFMSLWNPKARHLEQHRNWKIPWASSRLKNSLKATKRYFLTYALVYVSKLVTSFKKGSGKIKIFWTE